MTNYRNFEYGKLTLPKDHNEKRAFLECLQQKFIKEIKESEVCSSFFANYDPLYVGNFIVEYARQKAELIEYFQFLVNCEESDENEIYFQNARKVLNYILQKKLFNLQLQWRAGLINIEEIEASFDFFFWEKHVEYCPFIPSITYGEFEIMKKYLQKNSFASLEENDNWQYYFIMMEKDEEGKFINIPEWYDFYDLMFGTGSLLNLRDIRGEKEQFYIDKKNEHYVAPKKTENIPEKIYLPYLSTFHTEILKFSVDFEKDICFKSLFQTAYKINHPEYKDSNYVREFVDEALDVLENADREIVLPGKDVWYKEIIESANRYITDRTLEVLDQVYDDYLTLKNLGISQGFTPEEKAAELEKSFMNRFKEFILDGREVCGEPRDFDFYNK